MSKVWWRSWSAGCADFDLARISGLDLKHEWLNGHLVPREQLAKGDVWLTGNGYDSIDGPCYRATIYAEPYVYLRNEYDAFSTNDKWDLRFTYNPDLLSYQNTALLPVAGYWDCDGKVRHTATRTKTFGMVLGNKPDVPVTGYIGTIRTEFVNALRGRDFVYWGPGWDRSDPNYQGEAYLSDNKFFDSQKLLSSCKFALTFDNSVINGYLTEKFWNGLAAGCLPIYYGHEFIKTVVPEDAFIYGYDFDSTQEIIDYCESMSAVEWSSRTDVGFQFFRDDTSHSWESILAKVDSLIA